MRKWIKLIGYGGLAVVILGVCLQLIPVWALRTNPPVTSEPDWPSPEAQAIAQRACYDCHSNETQWPWYAYVAPPAWLVIFDVVRGRDEMNFSEWAHRRPDELEDVEEVLDENEMPPDTYLLLHPEAQLSAADKKTLLAAFREILK